MSPELWSKVESITDLVLAEPEAARETVLLRACGDDAELLAQVRQLLASMEEAPDGFLDLEDGQEILPDLAVGAEIGRFELVRELGSGGSGAVWEARQKDIQRRVALKISRTFACTQREIERLRREADMAGRLGHDHIVTVYEQGELPGCLWIAMELVEGHDLREEVQLQWRKAKGGRRAILPPGDTPAFATAVAAVGRDVAGALQAAHENGVLHRDIKPANVLLQPGGRPKVVDFGLAKVEADVSMSNVGEVVGTPYYMSPEQARGERVDARTDVYSLGAVLFHLLTGEVPFAGSSASEVLLAVCDEETPTLRQRRAGLPFDLEAVVAKAMEKRAEDRYYDAAALAEDLERFLARRPVVAKRYTAVRRGLRWMQRNARVLWMVAAVLLIVVGVAWAQRAGEHWRMEAILDERVDRLEEQVRRELSRDRDASLLAAVAARLDAMQRDHGDDHPEPVRRAVEVRERIAGVGRELLRDGEQGRAKLLADRRGVTPAEQVELFRVLEDFEGAARLLVDSGVVADEASISRWLPTLTLRCNRPGALVSLHRIELPSCEFASEGRLLGRTPLPPTKFFPGYYRVVVEDEGYGHAELSRWLGNWKEDYDLGDIVIRPFDQIRQDMVRFEAGAAPVTVPVYSHAGASGSVLSTAHRAFLIDRTEVSNGQYLAFLESVENPEWFEPGDYWVASADYRRRRDPQWMTRPVVSVSWWQASRYAEWAGKRLPSDAEWTKAAVVDRDGSVRPFPWGGAAARQAGHGRALHRGRQPPTAKGGSAGSLHAAHGAGAHAGSGHDASGGIVAHGRKRRRVDGHGCPGQPRWSGVSAVHPPQGQGMDLDPQAPSKIHQLRRAAGLRYVAKSGTRLSLRCLD